MNNNKQLEDRKMKLTKLLPAIIFTVMSFTSVQASASAQAEIDAAMQDSSTVDVFKKKSWLGALRFYGFQPSNPTSSNGLIISRWYLRRLLFNNFFEIKFKCLDKNELYFCSKHLI